MYDFLPWRIFMLLACLRISHTAGRISDVGVAFMGLWETFVKDSRRFIALGIFQILRRLVRRFIPFLSTGHLVLCEPGLINLARIDPPAHSTNGFFASARLNHFSSEDTIPFPLDSSACSRRGSDKWWKSIYNFRPTNAFRHQYVYDATSEAYVLDGVMF